MTEEHNDKWLNERQHSYYAQHGEDGIVEAILERLEIRSPWMVEFGAWDGLYNSNVLHFMETREAQVVLIEGEKDKFEKLLINHSENKKVYAINAFVSTEGKNSLDSLLASTPIPNDFDVLFIDVDGMDYHIWNSVVQYKPKCVVIEFNPTIPNEVDFVQEANSSLNHGNSIAAQVRLGKEKGYELVATTINNAFFVTKELFPKFEISNNSVAVLRGKSHVSYIFNGYDGTVFIRGSRWVDLHNMYYNEKKLQIFPKLLRGFSIKNPVKKLLYSWYKSLWKRNII